MNFLKRLILSIFIVVGCSISLTTTVLAIEPTNIDEAVDATIITDFPARTLEEPHPEMTINDDGGSYEIHAKVKEIIQDETLEGKRQIVFVASGDNGKEYKVDTTEGFTEGVRYDINKGNTVILQIVPGENETEFAYLSDIYRLPRIMWLFAGFALLILLIGRWRGVSALVGLGLTAVILFLYVFPVILQGGNPVLAVVIGSVLILAINMHLSHGFSRSTVLAFLSTVAGLFLALVFAYVCVYIAKLSGLASEDAAFLYWQNGVPLDLRGILLGAVILGATGVLDDIAITQGETVQELRSANNSLDRKELMRRAMRIGRHHIASTVNTLVLAYAGAAMPLLLLFLATKGVTFGQFINNEQVAEEIIRTLAGTSALILTVPIATYLATFAPASGRDD